MNIAKQPTKEQVRNWMHRRQTVHQPLPAIEQIRRELGWEIIQGEQDCVSSRRRFQ